MWEGWIQMYPEDSTEPRMREKMLFSAMRYGTKIKHTLQMSSRHIMSNAYKGVRRN